LAGDSGGVNGYVWEKNMDKGLKVHVVLHLRLTPDPGSGGGTRKRVVEKRAG
jgi:hypothetical protein